MYICNEAFIWIKLEPSKENLCSFESFYSFLHEHSVWGDNLFNYCYASSSSGRTRVNFLHLLSAREKKLAGAHSFRGRCCSHAERLTNCQLKTRHASRQPDVPMRDGPLCVAPDRFHIMQPVRLWNFALSSIQVSYIYKYYSLCEPKIILLRHSEIFSSSSNYKRAQVISTHYKEPVSEQRS